MTQPSFENISDLLSQWEDAHPNRIALADRAQTLNYGAAAACVRAVADALTALGIQPGDRVAVVADKRVEIVIAMFGCYRAGIVLVPVNPQLKLLQIQHILQDSGARILIGSEKRAPSLTQAATGCALAMVITPDSRIKPLAEPAELPSARAPAPGFENAALATLFYTSGSTGLPKAVATSHANILAGAQSVSTYLENTSDDVLLAILPLSFDAGFSQLTTGFRVGAKVVLRDYLLPGDISRTAADHGVTGITGVPAIWAAALRAKWEDDARHNIRYFANTGGHLPQERIEQLADLFPNAKPYPMYGLTEAFRSSYLPPSRIRDKKGSIGQAIPGATLVVVDENGAECAPGQSGELVHAGPTVALGYWNNAAETAKRFRPAPPALTERGITGTVVFSGDLVHRDADGFLFYEGRRDGQIKISGNRISFTEIEDIALNHEHVRAAAAGGRKRGLGTDPEFVLFVETDGGSDVADAVHARLKAELPGFSVPSRVLPLSQLILNNNNKYDVARMIALHDATDKQGRTDGTD